MKYPLGDLIRVRQRREDNAAIEVQTATHEVERAQQAWQESQQQLTQFQIQKPQLREEAYKKVMNQTCNMQDIDKLHSALGSIEQRWLDLHEQAQLAKQNIDIQQQKLNAAKTEYKQICASVQKLFTHREKWQQEQLFEQLKREEAELEDFNQSSESEH